MVRRCRAWHDIIALEQHTPGRTKSGMACHHNPWTPYTVRRRQACHDIIALGQHTILNDVGCDMLSLPAITRTYDVGCGMQSSSLDYTHGRATSCVLCHHRPWAAYTVGRLQELHASIALGLHTWSDYVGSGMPLNPLDSTDGHTTSAHPIGLCRAWQAIIGLGQHIWSDDVGAWHASMALGKHTRSDYVGRGVPLSPMGSTHVRQRRPLDVIISLGEPTRSDYVGCGMPSRPWKTHTVGQRLA
ncbi:hypothetical protein EJD97_001386 [Solanum chilense]|uniref:Uncharacterized protein n=1 Tax=Solanum chilense TaxID=4083 RepID=A0A6N2AM47_SOLCI|nr:hypothetical protein EJD97_001386 [Solanum chilense]